jgi:hypothetical protein
MIGDPTEPLAVTVLRLETDSTVSPVSFIGSEHYARSDLATQSRPRDGRAL